jgi:hypothetical protein
MSKKWEKQPRDAAVRLSAKTPDEKVHELIANGQRLVLGKSGEHGAPAIASEHGIEDAGTA